MQITYLDSSGKRTHGAQGRESLGDELLVFVYPRIAPRLFHTFRCSSLRIVGLREDGHVVHDEVHPGKRLVPIPACQYVLEMDPDQDYRPQLAEILATACLIGQQDRHAGPSIEIRAGITEGVRVDSLMFSLIARSLGDVRRVREAVSGAGKSRVDARLMREKFKAWERGQIASSAGFLLDFKDVYDLPGSALSLSRMFLEAEHIFLDELYAASVAGVPWQHNEPCWCLRCGRVASWRFIVTPPETAVPEMAWRYGRPENAVPLCFRCTETVNFNRDLSVRLDLVWGLWGPRFEAFWQWHQAQVEGFPPEWDRHAHPLWPSHYGGTSWATGSGAFQFAAPQLPIGIRRNKFHLEALARALPERRKRRRCDEKTPVPYLISSEKKSRPERDPLA